MRFLDYAEDDMKSQNHKHIILIGSLLLSGAFMTLPVSGTETTHSTENTNLSERHILARLDTITVDDFKIEKVSLSEALEHLDSIVKPHGMQILFQPIEGKDPTVNIKTRKLSLSRNLSLMCRQAGYDWTVENGVIMVATPGSGEELQTQIIPISSTTSRRLAASQGYIR